MVKQATTLTTLGRLDINPLWIGRDGEPKLRSDEDPGLIGRVFPAGPGSDNVGWGEGVVFNLDPKQADGKDMNEADVPGAGKAPFPTVSWRVRVEDEDRNVLGVAELDAYPDAEGDVRTFDLPVHLGTRPYDEAKGYKLKVVPGVRRGPSFKAGSSGRLFYIVWAFEATTGVKSEELAFAAS